MKKIKLFLVLCLLMFRASGQYIYPVIQCPSTAMSNDGMVEIKTVGVKMPCAYIAWGDNTNGWQHSAGFRAERLSEANGPLVVRMYDSTCRKFETIFTLYHDPAEQIIIDTILTVMPTPGHSDGSIQVIYANFPSGSVRYFGNDASGGVTSTNTYTGLSSGNYYVAAYNAHHPASIQISIPLMEINAPCIHFETTLEETLPSHPLSGTGCDGSLIVDASGPLMGDYWGDFTYSFIGGGGSIAHPFDSYDLDFENEVCRTLHTIEITNDDSRYWFYQYYFLPDSADVYKVWNLPDSVPSGTDTIRLQSIYSNLLNLADSVSLDTLYISDYVPLGANQFELTFTAIQDNDTFYFYNAPILDSAVSYCFDFTIHCDIGGTPPYNDHKQNFIYFPALNTRSDFFRTPPSNTVSVLNKVKLYPNPFNEQVNIYSGKKVRRVEVYTINGKLVHTAQVNNNFYTIEISGLPPSMYLLKVYSEDGSSQVSKITKM